MVAVGSFFGTALVADAGLSSTGIGSGFVVKLSSAGEVLWARLLTAGQAGLDKCNANGVAVDAQGDIVVVGPVTGELYVDGQAGGLPATTSSFVAKLDRQDGHLRWLLPLVGQGNTDIVAKAVALDRGNPNAAVYVTGTFANTVVWAGATWKSQGKNDVFVLEISP
jgi:hypothetical protein